MSLIKKILVTGSSGTIGTRLCEKLLEKGYEIAGVDLRPNKWNKQINDLTILGDLCFKEVFEKLPTDVDLIIHLAANARVYNLVVEPTLARDNFEMLFNVLEFTRQNKIKRFLFASSREVYGNSNKESHGEDEAYVKHCESPYTASKIGGEALINAYRQCYAIHPIILRFSNVYGMYDESDRVIPLFIRLARVNKDLIIFGKEKFLDFTYIDDCVAGVCQAIQRFNDFPGDVFNISSGRGVSILETAQLIKDLIKSKSKIILAENRTGEIIRFVADISKAQDKLNFQSQIDINQGIEKSIDWYNKFLV